MSPPPTASIWSATPMRPCPIPAARRTAPMAISRSRIPVPQSGQAIGQASALDPHLSGGSLKGLIDMRDQTLGGLAQSLGNFAQNVRTGLQRPVQRQCRLSAAHLADRPRYRPACPPMRSISPARPPSPSPIPAAIWSAAWMSISTPAHLSVDGGAAASIGTTRRQLHHRPQHRAGLQRQRQLRQWPAFHFRHRRQRHGGAGQRHHAVRRAAARPFSQFFGLNDLFQSAAPSILATGLSGSRRQRPGGRRPDRHVAQGPGRRHRQAGLGHHHRRHDHRPMWSARSTPRWAGRPPSP